jgi:hypothetical protein
VVLVALAEVGGWEEAGVGRPEEAVGAERAVEAAVADGSWHTRHAVVAALSSPAQLVADGYRKRRMVDLVADCGALSTGDGRQRWLWLRRANFGLPGAHTRMSGCSNRMWLLQTDPPVVGLVAALGSAGWQGFLACASDRKVQRAGAGGWQRSKNGSNETKGAHSKPGAGEKVGGEVAWGLLQQRAAKR